MFPTGTLATLTIVGALALARQAGPQTRTDTPQTFALTSSAFVAGAEIPAQYTCTGEDNSPAFTWSGVPAHTSGFALIADDPDAPGRTWVHWVIWNIPPTSHGVPSGEPKRPQLEDGSSQGQNDFQHVGYNGPCPPASKAHRYFFRLYALSTKIELPPGSTRADLDAAIKDHILAQAEYMGTFHR